MMPSPLAERGDMNASPLGEKKKTLMDPQLIQAILFWAVALLTGICAIGVVVTQNIVRSATWLLFTLAGTSAVFFLLGADFVGATQLLVYVGGTLVLVVFGVMLTAQGPFVNLKAGAAEWAFTAIVGIMLLGVLTVTLAVWQPAPAPVSELMTDPAGSLSGAALGQSFLGIKEVTPEAKLTGLPKPETAPERTRMSYFLPFEIVSIHLLVVLIGAAYLARAKRRRGAALP
jgi:NADH-quinone oxidoreductase subunit J